MRKSISPRTAALLFASIVGGGVFAAGCVSDVLVLATGGNPWLGLVDDFGVAAFAATLVLYFERRQDAELQRKLCTIAEMNHHVRNQLEVIEYSAWTTHDKTHISRMQDSVGRIEGAMREILGHEHQMAPLPPPKPPAYADPIVIRHDRRSADSASPRA